MVLNIFNHSCSLGSRQDVAYSFQTEKLVWVARFTAHHMIVSGDGAQGTPAQELIGSCSDSSPEERGLTVKNYRLKVGVRKEGGRGITMNLGEEEYVRGWLR